MGCAGRARKGCSRDDVAFWVDHRGLQLELTKDGRRIYGTGLEEGKTYELVPLAPEPRVHSPR